MDAQNKCQLLHKAVTDPYEVETFLLLTDSKLLTSKF
jgi:hypothetical protein